MEVFIYGLLKAGSVIRQEVRLSSARFTHKDPQAAVSFIDGNKDKIT